MYIFYRIQNIQAMHINQNLFKELAAQANAMNVANGGLAQPMFQVETTETGIMIKVMVPSLGEEAYHVQVNQDNLIIYTVYHGSEQAIASNSQPTLVQQYPLPVKVDKARIDAHYENKALTVHLPFLSDEDQKPRDIDIRRDNY